MTATVGAWACPWCEIDKLRSDLTASQLERDRYKGVVEIMSRMRCHPDKSVMLTTVSAAITMAEQVLSALPQKEHHD